MRSGRSESRDDWLLIRHARPEDRLPLERLWQACFGDSDAFTRYYFDHYFQENEVLTAFAGEDLIGQLHLNPYPLAAGGEQLSGIYIVGVGTDERYRHRGVMTALLKRAFEQLSAGKLPFAYLMPADEEIYKPFGFTYIYRQEVLVLLSESEAAGALWASRSAVPQRDEGCPDEGCPGTGCSDDGYPDDESPDAGNSREGRLSDIKKEEQKQSNPPVEPRVRSFSVRPAAAWEEYENLAEIANDILHVSKDIYTLRDAEYFRRLQLENRADGGDLLLFRGGNGMIGYTSFACEGSAEIREVWAAPGWEKTLYTWIIRVFAGRQTTVLPLPGCIPANSLQDGIWYFPQAGGAFSRKERPIIMGRIICLQSFLELCTETECRRNRKAFTRTHLLLDISDEWIPENAGLWEWQAADSGKNSGRCSCSCVRQLEAGDTDKEPDVHMGIDALLEWLTGYRTPEELAEQGRMCIRRGSEEMIRTAPRIHGFFLNEIV